jgi:hypothetical protein
MATTALITRLGRHLNKLGAQGARLTPRRLTTRVV